MTVRTGGDPRDLAAVSSGVRLLERAADASGYRFDALLHGISDTGDPE